jgi:membrane protein YdbS with pleckstrin-like domain
LPGKFEKLLSRNSYMNRLEKKVLIPWIGGSIISAILLAGLAAAVQAVISRVSPVLTAGFLLLFSVIGIDYSVERFKSWGFELREDYLYIEHGVLTKVRSKVPYVRVQHVDTQRGPVYRFFGLSKLVVFTAGSRGADVGIPGLLPGRAEEIQERLRKVAVESEEGFGDAV